MNAGDQPAFGFYVFPTAATISSGLYGGRSQLEYHVQAKYPAREVIRWISDKLKTAGWQTVDYDVLNPEIRPSQARQWLKIIDGHRSHELYVQSWGGYWRDRAGNFVMYAFRYSDPSECTDHLTDLEVNAAYLRAEDVRSLVHDTGQWDKGQRLRIEKAPAGFH